MDIFNFKRKRDKRAVEWEIGKIIIAVILLILIGFGIYFLLVKKGFGDEGILSYIKKLLRLGKA
jgi:hypothetical protein